MQLIEQEIANQQAGCPARIVCKLNQLEDPEICALLVEASQAGVQIDLIVRGLCCLAPAVAGLTENIRIRSIIGRFLEHSRIYHFAAGADDPLDGEFLIGSADWMHRNLSERVEAAVPITRASPPRPALGDPAGLPRRPPQRLADAARRRATSNSARADDGAGLRGHARDADATRASTTRRLIVVSPSQGAALRSGFGARPCANRRCTPTPLDRGSAVCVWIQGENGLHLELDSPAEGLLMKAIGGIDGAHARANGKRRGDRLAGMSPRRRPATSAAAGPESTAGGGR